MKTLISPQLPDQLLERVRQNHHDVIRELQQSPFAEGKIISNVLLPDSVATTLTHGLGRAPKWVSASCVREPSTSGIIEEIRTGVDRTKFVVLKASGFGATVSVDVVLL